MSADSDSMGRADLQIHTDASDGMDDAKTILDAAHRRNLDVIAVTDHDQTRGAQEARGIAERSNHPVEVIIGSEVSSRQGHILALWIDSPIAAFKSAEATIEAIWRQGGVAIISHPAAIVPFALSIGDIDRLVATMSLELSGDHPPILAVETANPIPSARWRRQSIISANQRWSLPTTGGSDAHFHEQVGAGITRYQGRGAQALRDALISNQTSAELDHYPSLREIGAGRLLRQQWRGMTATPRALLARRLGSGRVHKDTENS